VEKSTARTTNVNELLENLRASLRDELGLEKDNQPFKNFSAGRINPSPKQIKKVKVLIR
jgi:hypothetical protein